MTTRSSSTTAGSTRRPARGRGGAVRREACEHRLRRVAVRGAVAQRRQDLGAPRACGAETAKTLTVFQRTANYSVPARNHPLSPERKQELTERFEEIRDLVRSTPNAHPFRISADKAADQDAETLAERYEKAWEIGGLRFRAVFGDLLVDKGANDTAATFLKGKIREIVKDPATAAILSNIDHPYAAKRPPIDTNYFDTFNKPHVSVVDVRADPIRRIVPEGIELESGKVHELDVIVFATGFDAWT